MTLLTITTLTVIIAAFVAPIHTQAVNNYPLIGILSVPAEGWNGYVASEWSYFSASYVKFLEAGGAQVVPIQWDLPLDQIDSLLGQLNGVLFTGGGTPDLSNTTNPNPIYAVYQHIVSYVLNQNANGNYYPLWGTCQGYEVIARVLANNMTILTPCVKCSYVNKNNYPVATYASRMLKGLSWDLQQKITNANLSLFDQQFKLDIVAFSENPLLSGNVTQVAYAIDQAETTYVSMYESPTIPLYAIQFHQEKATFEWKPNLNIGHTPDSVLFEEYLGNFFVNECRKNFNTFPQNMTHLIYNYNTTVAPASTFNEIYLFPTQNSTAKHNARPTAVKEGKVKKLAKYLMSSFGFDVEDPASTDLFGTLIDAADNFLGA